MLATAENIDPTINDERGTAQLNSPVKERVREMGSNVTEVVLENETRAVLFEGGRAKNEGGAYLVSDACGFNLIPPTLPGENETVQLYLDGWDRQIHRQRYDSPGMRKQILGVYLFDYITARDDSQGYIDNSPYSANKNHRVINGKIVPHDYEFAFNKPNDNSFNKKYLIGADIDEDTIENLKKIDTSLKDKDLLKKRMKDIGHDDETIDGVLNRLHKIVEVVGHEGVVSKTLGKLTLRRNRKFTERMMRELNDFVKESS
jgi:hypothetical protein